jgi:hypothetical protein
VTRTNRYLRFALFAFGTIVVWAAVGLSLLLLDLKEEWALAWTAILAGAIAVALAAFLVVGFGSIASASRKRLPSGPSRS